METSSQQLLHRAVAHIMNEMRNEGELDAWMDTHCSLFGTDVKAENDLAFTELHKEYETLVERSLEGFMATEHVGSTQVLFDLMVDATHKSPTSNRHMDVLLASGDFQVRAGARESEQVSVCIHGDPTCQCTYALYEDDSYLRDMMYDTHIQHTCTKHKAETCTSIKHTPTSTNNHRHITTHNPLHTFSSQPPLTRNLCD